MPFQTQDREEIKIHGQLSYPVISDHFQSHPTKSQGKLTFNNQGYMLHLRFFCRISKQKASQVDSLSR